MTPTRTQKKLARVITRMIDENLTLILQPDGSYAARHVGKVCARLSAQEARKTCADGVLDMHSDKTLHINTQSCAWLARYNAKKPDEAFSGQHRDMQKSHLIDGDGKLFDVHKNMAESPLAWLRQHKGADKAAFLSAAEFAAGERLRADYYYSSLSQKLCVDLETPARGSTPRGPRNPVLDAADNALAAKDRFMNALGALGPGLDDIIFCLCIRETSLEAIEKARKWPKRTGKVVLKLALDRLARHYGLLC